MFNSLADKELWPLIDASRMERLLLRFLKIPSPTGKEKNFSEEYADSLKEIGLKVILDRSFAKSPNVIAIFRGLMPEPVLQFDGHTDTIALAHSKPYVKGGKIYGRGACDMKGALVAMLESARIIIESGIKLNGTLLFTAHGLHEAPLGRNETLDDLIKKRHLGDAVVIGECAHDTLPLEGKGLFIFEIMVKRKGEVLHELKGENVTNPIWIGNEIVSRLRRKFFVGKFESGDFYNRIPLTCNIVGTRRYSYKMGLNDVKKELQDIVSQVNHYPDVRIHLDIRECADGFKISPKTGIVKSLKRAYAITTGQPLRMETVSVVGNLPWFIKAGVPAVYHGLDQRSAHADIEYVSLKELVRLTKVYLALIVDYLGVSS